MSESSHIRIVFYGHCGAGHVQGAGRRSIFFSQVEAETAASIYSQKAGYPCEAFACNKHSLTGLNRWHIRAKFEEEIHLFMEAHSDAAERAAAWRERDQLERRREQERLSRERRSHKLVSAANRLLRSAVA